MGEFPNKATQFSKDRQPAKERHGRPKGALSIKKLIREVWEEEITDDNGNPRIRALLSIKAMIDKCEGGDVHAFRALCERMEGMPKQELDVTDKTYLHKNLADMTTDELKEEKKRLESLLND